MELLLFNFWWKQRSLQKSLFGADFLQQLQLWKRSAAALIFTADFRKLPPLSSEVFRIADTYVTLLRNIATMWYSYSAVIAMSNRYEMYWISDANDYFTSERNRKRSPSILLKGASENPWKLLFRLHKLKQREQRRVNGTWQHSLNCAKSYNNQHQVWWLDMGKG